MALQLLLPAFDGLFDQLEIKFLDLADKTSEKQLRDSYMLAQSEIRAKRETLREEFRNSFIESFKNQLSELAAGAQKSSPLKVESSLGELSLVANDEYEERLISSSMASEFVRTGGDDLRQLESRLASLIPARASGESVNPISPDAICDAVRNACRKIESGSEVRLVAMREFETQLSQQVATAYRQINKYLTLQNVQPVGFRIPARSAGKGVPSREGTPTMPERSAPPAVAEPAPTGMVNVVLPATLANHFEQLLNGRAGTSGQNISGAPVSTDMRFLDQLQQGGLGSGDEYGDISLRSEQENLVNLLQGSPWAHSLSQLDSMTLSLVSMLFDRLFEDARLPDGIKSLLGRLQIPVLKVALSDGTFFARKNHPARQLLDRIAESAIDWTDTDKERRLDKLSAIVSWVIVNFEDDVSIFEQALFDIESYLLVEADIAIDQILPDTQVLTAAELSELGRATAESVISGRLFGRAIPPLVTEFAQAWWVLALAAAYGPAGENEPRFTAYVSALDELLWSIEPKRTTEERLRLVNILPEMLKSLESGAELAGMPSNDRQAFMSELVHCHAAAIRNGNREPHPQPPVMQSAPTVSAVVADEYPPLDPDALPKRWEWFELDGDDAEKSCKLRLTWISPLGTRYLFTNRDGGNGHTFTLAELEMLLRQNRLRRDSLSTGLTSDVFVQLRESLAA